MGLFSSKKSTGPKGKGKTEPQASLASEEKTPKSPVKATEKKTDLPIVKTRLITRPMLTEKSTGLEVQDQYVFIVDKRANKTEIRKEIEKLFNISVKSVNIINKKRKQRVWKGKKGFSPGLKKAIVTVTEGQKIEILPN